MRPNGDGTPSRPAHQSSSTPEGISASFEPILLTKIIHIDAAYMHPIFSAGGDCNGDGLCEDNSLKGYLFES